MKFFGFLKVLSKNNVGANLKCCVFTKWHGRFLRFFSVLGKKIEKKLRKKISDFFLFLFFNFGQEKYFGYKQLYEAPKLEIFLVTLFVLIPSHTELVDAVYFRTLRGC